MYILTQCLLHLSTQKNHSYSLFVFPHYQRTPLHFAARENYERTVECLVDKGADINIRDVAGVSTLVSFLGLYSVFCCLQYDEKMQ